MVDFWPFFGDFGALFAGFGGFGWPLGAAEARTQEVLLRGALDTPRALCRQPNFDGKGPNAVWARVGLRFGDCWVFCPGLWMGAFG